MDWRVKYVYISMLNKHTNGTMMLIYMFTKKLSTITINSPYKNLSDAIVFMENLKNKNNMRR